jgi:hypothetical protein
MSKPEETSPPKRRTKSTGYTPNFIKTAFNAMKGHKREKSKDKELAGIAGNNSGQPSEDHNNSTDKKLAHASSTNDVRRSPEKQIRPKSTVNGTEQSLDREVLLTEFRKLVEETSTSRTPPVSPATKPRRKLSEAEKKKKRSTLVGPLTKDDLLTPLNFNTLSGSAPGSSTNTPLASSGEGSPRQPSPTSADLAKSGARRRSISPMEKNARRTTSMQGELSKSGPSIVVNDSQVNGESEKLAQRLQKQKREQLQKQLDKQSELKREHSSSKMNASEVDSAAVPRSNSLSEADREQWRQVKAIDVVNLILRIGREQHDLKLPIDQLDLLTSQAMPPTPLQFV